MSDGSQGPARMPGDGVPYASFSRLSATNVVFGLTWPQILVALTGLALAVAGCLLAFNPVLIVPGVVLIVVGFLRWDGLSLLDHARILRRWRSRLRDGSSRWAYSPMRDGRAVGVLGLWGHVEERAKPIELRGPEVDARFSGSCFLFDPDKRQATAVLGVKVEEWALTANGERRSRAQALSNLVRELAETPGFRELKETAFTLPGPHPEPPSLDGLDDPDGWMGADQRELYALPAVLTPMQNLSYVSVSVDADRIRAGSRGGSTERVEVGEALDRLCMNVVAPALMQCGARPGHVRLLGVDDLRDLIRDVADQGERRDPGFVLSRDMPTVTWCEESKDGTYLTLDSCVARSYWILQYPDRPVPAGFLRGLLTQGRSMAFCHVWRPLSMEQSENDLRRRENSIEQRSKLQDTRRKSHDERREEKEQRQRELEQEANWPDTDHQGVIILFAPDLPSLESFDKDMRANLRSYRIDVRPMRGQQREALTMVLPLGI